MVQMRIDLTGGRSGFEPGEIITGTARWEGAAHGVREAEIQLIWTTSGYGDPESCVAASMGFVNPMAQDQRPFQLRLPRTPYSMSGRLLAIDWAVRLMINRGAAMDRQPILVGPGGRATPLHRDRDQKAPEAVLRKTRSAQPS